MKKGTVIVRSHLALEFAKTPEGQGTIVKFRDIPRYRLESKCDVCRKRLKWKHAVMVDIFEDGGEYSRYRYCGSYCFNLGVPNLADYAFSWLGTWATYLKRHGEIEV